MSELTAVPEQLPTMPQRLRLWGVAVVVFAAGFAADQLTKLWALSALGGGVTIPLVPTVTFRLAFNPGVAFGMGADAGPLVAVGILLILATLSFWILWTIWRGSASNRVLLLTAVAAGGWGNMYDRITRAEGAPLSGTVVDYIAVDWFAIFNFGDVLAVCGMVAWALSSAFARPQVSTTTASR